MQTLIAVGLGHRQPVAHTFGVGLIHVGDDRVGLPALHFLFFQGGVEDNADGEKVVDALEATLLFLHLLPDAVDALGAAFHMKFQARSLQLLLDGADKPLDVGVAGAFGGIQLVFDHVIGIVLQILQTEVLQLALQLV